MVPRSMCKDEAEHKQMLRDEFAAKAMQGMIAINNEYIEVIAGKAYRMADAMLAEREKDND